MNYKALLFDFDGVLGDSLTDNYHAWSYAFQKLNLEFDKEKYFSLEGRKSTLIIEELLSDAGVSQDHMSDILADKDKHYAENNKFRYYDGVEDLVSHIPQWPVKAAVVSGGSAKRILHRPSNRLLGVFDVIVTGDDCTCCKPDPEPYLNAAQQLGVDPSECIVVENAPLGIQSAKNAGMFCVALRSTLKDSYLEEADCVLTDLSEAIQYFNEMFSL